MLTLSPILAVIAGLTFVVKAGMLSGSFYVSAAALFLTAVPMAIWPDYGPLMFGVVSAVCFFVPGLKYHRQRLRALRETAAACPPTVNAVARAELAVRQRDAFFGPRRPLAGQGGPGRLIVVHHAATVGAAVVERAGTRTGGPAAFLPGPDAEGRGCTAAPLPTRSEDLVRPHCRGIRSQARLTSTR